MSSGTWTQHNVKSELPYLCFEVFNIELRPHRKGRWVMLSLLSPQFFQAQIIQIALERPTEGLRRCGFQWLACAIFGLQKCIICIIAAFFLSHSFAQISQHLPSSRETMFCNTWSPSELSPCHVRQSECLSSGQGGRFLIPKHVCLLRRSNSFFSGSNGTLWQPEDLLCFKTNIRLRQCQGAMKLQCGSCFLQLVKAVELPYPLDFVPPNIWRWSKPGQPAAGQHDLLCSTQAHGRHSNWLSELWQVASALCSTSF